MSDPVRIRDVPHGIVYRQSEDADGVLSGVSKEVLKECLFRSKNAVYRSRTSQIGAPESLYEEVYRQCEDELRKRSELTKTFDYGRDKDGIGG